MIRTSRLDSETSENFNFSANPSCHKSRFLIYFHILEPQHCENLFVGASPSVISCSTSENMTHIRRKSSLIHNFFKLNMASSFTFWRKLISLIFTAIRRQIRTKFYHTRRPRIPVLHSFTYHSLLITFRTNFR